MLLCAYTLLDNRLSHIDCLFQTTSSAAIIWEIYARHINTIYISQLDPTGARQRLFARSSPEGAKVGDILLVRTKNGDPFAGVLINIRQRGVDTAILLRNEVLRTSVEMWFKIYSPLVDSVEIVQRRQKRARRARLTYMRKPRHDMGSVQNIVRQYLRQQATLMMASETKGRNKANSEKKGK
ncbi:MAG: hypothetical protein M1823_003045 [Watsoniomyces obsoletus]|nr:MAG: hypothetical protein M1823_003045 [Watsoniomyces obsoletus]